MGFGCWVNKYVHIVQQDTPILLTIKESYVLTGLEITHVWFHITTQKLKPLIRTKSYKYEIL